jgi:predicted MFS family arabinose efflux permease
MPITDFFMGGDPKFMIVLTGLLVLSIMHFVKKLKAKNDPENQSKIVAERNSKLRNITTWSLILATFSLLLGLMHSFYFIGQVGGVATNLLFQGLSYALITPVYGIVIALISNGLAQMINASKSN